MAGNAGSQPAEGCGCKHLLGPPDREGGNGCLEGQIRDRPARGTPHRHDADGLHQSRLHRADRLAGVRAAVAGDPEELVLNTLTAFALGLCGRCAPAPSDARRALAGGALPQQHARPPKESQLQSHQWPTAIAEPWLTAGHASGLLGERHAPPRRGGPLRGAAARGPCTEQPGRQVVVGRGHLTGVCALETSRRADRLRRYGSLPVAPAEALGLVPPAPVVGPPFYGHSHELSSIWVSARAPPSLHGRRALAASSVTPRAASVP